MGHTADYQQARLADGQVELLRQRIYELGPRLEDHHLLALSETLHDMLRRRRGGRSFQRVDLRL